MAIFCAACGMAFGAAGRSDVSTQAQPVDLVGFTTESATATFVFDAGVLEDIGWTVAATGETDVDLEGIGATLDVLPGSEVLIETARKRFTGGVHGQLRTMGGFMIGGTGQVLYVPNPTLRGDNVSGWHVETVVGGVDEPVTVFTITDALVEFGQSVQNMTLSGSLVLAEDGAGIFGYSDLVGRSVGTVQVELQLVLATEYMLQASGDNAGSALAMTMGADLIVGDLHAPPPSRRAVSGTISAYALGTTACNIGDEPIGWFAMSDDAPVITSNLYRLRNNQFEQIGMSWMKYGFSLAGGNLCSAPAPCVPMGAGLFPPGCSDVYSISTNAFQGNLAPRNIVNPTTGVFTYTQFAHPCPSTSCIDRLLQVERNDLEPDLNAGARYFAEAHYITPDDAQDGNGDNNASYREAFVIENPANTYSFTYSLVNPPTISATRREKPGILAWQEVDPAVGITYIDVPGDRRFILGYRAIDLGGGQWQYEYAVQNLNSDRSGQSFTVPLTDPVTVTNVGFRDIADHSGVPFDTTDWSATLGASSVSWATSTEAVNANANALRWGSLYNFRFTTDSPPQAGEITLGLFKAGTPAAVTAAALVPGPRRLLAESIPPDGSIDARQPFALDGTNATGWSSVEWTCFSSTICAALSASNFVITQTGGSGTAPSVLGLLPVAPDIVGVVLQHPIHEMAWTTFTLMQSADRLRLGYLPGDVNADSTSDEADVNILISRLSSPAALPIWSTDINRDDVFDTEDVVRLVDLLNGAGSYDPYLGVSLPTIP